jgi:periplasmic divalent cation tolerance protein
MFDAPWYRPRMDEVLVVLSTFPSEDKAAAVARTLVEEKLAACVNLVPAVRSIYRWQGAVEDGAETLAIIKTSRAQFDAMADLLVKLHPYDVPEVIGLPVATGHGPYLAWVISNVG